MPPRGPRRSGLPPCRITSYNVCYTKLLRSSLLSSIELAAKIVNREINQAGLSDILGTMGQANIQGEEQQKLDWFANEKFKAALAARGEVCGLASEEEDDFIAFEDVAGRQFV